MSFLEGKKVTPPGDAKLSHATANTKRLDR